MAVTKQTDKKKKPQGKWTFIRRVNVLIRRTSRGEVLTFLLFVVAATLFWAGVTSNEESTQEFIVNVHIDDQPQDMVFTTRVPTQLRVTLTDTNWLLFRYKYRDQMEELSINFERYADAMGNFRVSAAELQSMLRTELEGSTRIAAVSPSLIDARFAQTEGRKYAVQLLTPYLPADNYRLHPILIEPDSVIVNAPTAVLDTLRFVLTMASTHQSQNLRDTLCETLSLELPLGVKATPNRVKVTAPISEYVEKVLTNAELKVKGTPKDRQLVVFPYLAKVTCLVDLPFYHSVDETDFDVWVDYPTGANIGDHGRLPISIRYKGDDANVVSHITVLPIEAEYVVEPIPNIHLKP